MRPIRRGAQSLSLVFASLLLVSACDVNPVGAPLEAPSFSHVGANTPPNAFITNNLFLQTGDRVAPNTVSVIDAFNDSKIATITVGVGAFNVAITPDGRFAYVTNLIPVDVAQETSEVSVVATADNSVVTTVPVGRLARGLTVTPDGDRVYVANSGAGTISVIETTSHSVVSTIPISDRADGPGRIAITPDGNSAYVTHSVSGRVSVLDLASEVVTASITVDDGPIQPSISPDGSAVYVNNAVAGTVSVIATSTNTVVATIAVGANTALGDLIVTPDGQRVFVSVNGGVVVIDAQSNSVLATVPMSAPHGLAATPDGRFVYATNLSSGTATVIDVLTNTVDRIVPDVGPAPFDIEFVPVRNPQQLIARLIIEVTALRDAGRLSEGVANSLLKKLDVALVAVLADRPNAAGILGAFVNEVVALMPPPEPGVLPSVQGQPLVDLGLQAIDLLSN